MEPIIHILDQAWNLYLTYQWHVIAFVGGLTLGLGYGLRIAWNSISDHQESLRRMVILVGNLRGATEVLEEHDLMDEATERGEHYAEQNIIDIRTHTATQPSLIDRALDYLPGRGE